MIYVKMKEFEVIDVVSDTKNISHAAIKMQMQQANVSKYISDLEERIGLKIFDRNSRSVVLTNFGEVLLPYIKKQIEIKQEVVEFINDYKKNNFGPVAIYASIEMMPFVSKVITQNIKKSDNVSLLLKTYSNQSLDINDKSIFPNDCDILLSHNLPKNENLVASRIFTYNVGFYATPKYLEEHNYPVTCCSEAHPLISTYSIYNIFRGDGSISFDLDNKYLCDNSQVAVDLALNGLGILISTSYNVQSEIASGKLIECTDKFEKKQIDVYMIFKIRKYQPERVRYIMKKMFSSFHGYIE